VRLKCKGIGLELFYEVKLEKESHSFRQVNLTVGGSVGDIKVVGRNSSVAKSALRFAGRQK